MNSVTQRSIAPVILILSAISFSLIALTALAQVDLLPDIETPIGAMYVNTFGMNVDTFVTFEHEVTDQFIPGRIHVRLTFGTANIGLGPMEFGGVLPANPDGSRDAVQRIKRSDGSWWERPAGLLAFHQEHGHTHLEDWAQYRIREITAEGGVGPIVAEGPKAGFCVIDLEPYDLSLTNASQTPRYGCGDTLQGISVGWIDFYWMELEGQEIDITDIPNGKYWLEGEFDPIHRFLESDTTNNFARKQIVLCHNSFTEPTSDSMWMSHTGGAAGESVRVDVFASNEIPLGGVEIPFTWAGSLNLAIDSISVKGARSESSFNPKFTAFNPFNSSASVALVLSDPNSPGLLPGSGPILSLYFSYSVASETPDTNTIAFTNFAGMSARLSGLCGAYTPQTLLDGSFSSLCCNLPGDANNSGSLNISDATFLIAYIFSGGVEPPCLDEGDANGDGRINISDATYEIAIIFQGGAPAVCP